MILKEWLATNYIRKMRFLNLFLVSKERCQIIKIFYFVLKQDDFAGKKKTKEVEELVVRMIKENQSLQHNPSVQKLLAAALAANSRLS